MSVIIWRGGTKVMTTCLVNECFNNAISWQKHVKIMYVMVLSFMLNSAKNTLVKASLILYWSQWPNGTLEQRLLPQQTSHNALRFQTLDQEFLSIQFPIIHPYHFKYGKFTCLWQLVLTKNRGKIAYIQITSSTNRLRSCLLHPSVTIWIIWMFYVPILSVYNIILHQLAILEGGPDPSHRPFYVWCAIVWPLPRFSSRSTPVIWKICQIFGKLCLSWQCPWEWWPSSGWSEPMYHLVS